MDFRTIGALACATLLYWVSREVNQFEEPRIDRRENGLVTPVL
jgi:hypothetical protein